MDRVVSLSELVALIEPLPPKLVGAASRASLRVWGRQEHIPPIDKRDAAGLLREWSRKLKTVIIRPP